MYVRLQGTFTLRSPLSHIGESIGNRSYLAEEPIIQPDGDVELVFAYSGNAWRGQLRDLMADYMLDHLGAPLLPLDSFHLLYAGGAIGGTQSVDLNQIRAYRRIIPMVSLLGGGVGNQLIPGKLRVGNCYPVCVETLPILPESLHERAEMVSYGQITFEREYSRHDDSKIGPRADRIIGLLPSTTGQQTMLLPPPEPMPETSERPQQMRVAFELLAPGAALTTEIELQDGTEVELGALVSAIHTFSRSPHIGGKAAQGFGRVTLNYDLIDLDTGEVQPFITIGDGGPKLAPPAQAAKQAYDDHLRTIYNEFLTAHDDGIGELLGAQPAMLSEGEAA